MTAEWKEKCVGEILQLEYGRPLAEADRRPNGRFPVFGANGEKDRTDKFYHDKPSIVVGRKGSAGEINLTEGKFWPLDVTYFVTFDESEYNLRFLYYLLRDLNLPRFARGVKPGINRNDVYLQRIRVPPLAEQRRIVGVLDKVYAGISSARLAAEANLRNATALFDTYLAAAFSSPEGRWTQKLLSELAYFRNGLNYTKQSKGEHVRIVGVRDFQNNFLAPLNDLDEVAIDGRLRSDDLLEQNDILTVRSNGNVELIGRCVLVGEVADRVSHSGFTIRVRLKTNEVIPRFLCYFLKSPRIRKNLTQGGTGTNIKSLNQETLSGLTIPIPPLPRQRRLIEQFDGLALETQRLANIYRRKLIALEELRKSLLQRAFSGDMVQSSRQAVISTLPAQISGVTTTDLHAGILAMAYHGHDKIGRASYFGHVKAEKIAHLVEAHAGINLARQAVKDALGPNDYRHLLGVEHRARKAGYFDFKRVKGGGYRVTKLRRFDVLVQRTRTALGSHCQAVDELLALMLPMTKQQAEIVATVYAAWNNLLLDGKNPKDEEIVFEARENWHREKLKIPRDRFFKALAWMRAKKMVPTGNGRKVLAKNAA